ncbi:TPM domain-containing protein [Patescibacteria group bacterium]|nr:TPM domain-containing protein [Patescibacteria group bacterium]
MKKLITSLILSLILAPTAFALDVPAPPYRYIRDDANIISEDTEADLDAYISKIEDDTTAEIAILTIPTLEDAVLEEFALEVLRGWGIGREGADNGVLLLVAVQEHEVRIEVGYGLEGRITDYNSKQIIDYTIIPAFKKEDFDTGIENAILELGDLITEEAQEDGFAQTTTVNKYKPSMSDLFLLPLLAGLFFGFVNMIFLFLLPIKAGEKVQKWPLPHAWMSAILLMAESAFESWIFGLIFATLIYLVLKKIDLKQAKSGGGGGTPTRHNTYRPPTHTSGSIGRSSGGGGRSFGGGSGGGGGASGRW